VNKRVLILGFKNTESLIRTVCGSEFQTDGAENWKAPLKKSVPVNGLTSSGMADEHRVRLQTRSVTVVQVNWSGHAPNLVCIVQTCL